jgi:hypothetical protein
MSGLEANFSRSFVAAAQQFTGKTCRMEQQCHWENFKKLCTPM